jgi:hypothetical protein
MYKKCTCHLSVPLSGLMKSAAKHKSQKSKFLVQPAFKSMAPHSLQSGPINNLHVCSKHESNVLLQPHNSTPLGQSSLRQLVESTDTCFATCSCPAAGSLMVAPWWLNLLMSTRPCKAPSETTSAKVGTKIFCNCKVTITLSHDGPVCFVNSTYATSNACTPKSSQRISPGIKSQVLRNPGSRFPMPRRQRGTGSVSAKKSTCAGLLNRTSQVIRSVITVNFLVHLGSWGVNSFKIL